ncbi:hypothetical protein [Streptomyces mayteni]
MRIPTTYRAGAAGAAILLLAGCGTDQDASGGDDGAGDRADQAADASPEPMPLDLTQRRATWTEVGNDAPVHQVEITPVGLARGAKADLERIDLDEDRADSVPYYFTFRVTATGADPVPDPDLRGFFVVGTDGERSDRRLEVYANTPLMSRDDLAAAMPTACNAPAPDILKPGDTAEVCHVLLAPPDLVPASVFYEDDSGEAIYWLIEQDPSAATRDLLPADQPADVVWESLVDGPFPLHVSPPRVTEASSADLQATGYADRLEEEDLNRIPYFVTFEYRNDHTELDLYPEMSDGVELLTTSGEPGYGRNAGMRDAEPGDPCPSVVPYALIAPGDTVQRCTVHLLNPGDSPTGVSFDPQGDAEPVRWALP